MATPACVFCLTEVPPPQTPGQVSIPEVPVVPSGNNVFVTCAYCYSMLMEKQPVIGLTDRVTVIAKLANELSRGTLVPSGEGVTTIVSIVAPSNGPGEQSKSPSKRVR
jgi:hypothetical protein